MSDVDQVATQGCI